MRSKVWIIFLTLSIFQICNSRRRFQSERDAKFLFNVVKFQNTPCQSTSQVTQMQGTGFRTGTCYTAQECAHNGGQGAGSCAASFGVCCVFIVTSNDVTQNCTYIQNEGFPSNFDGATSTFTIRRCGNVCQIRLDFETFSTLGPANTLEVNGGACVDTLTFQSSASAGNVYPVICGQNAGQHAIIDIGNMDGDTATLMFNFAGGMAGASRMFDIKVTQIPCNSLARAPQGCFQSFTGISGRIETFNFRNQGVMAQHLANQDYTICIRQEIGYCCIEYTVCQDAMSFSINTAGGIGAGRMGRVDDACGNANNNDYIGITGLSSTCTGGETGVMTVSKVCGDFFVPVTTAAGATLQSVSLCDCQEPFDIRIFTDSVNDNTVAGQAQPAQSRGVCLDWRQLPCTN